MLKKYKIFYLFTLLRKEYANQVDYYPDLIDIRY